MHKGQLSISIKDDGKAITIAMKESDAAKKKIRRLLISIKAKFMEPLFIRKQVISA